VEDVKERQDRECRVAAQSLSALLHALSGKHLNKRWSIAVPSQARLCSTTVPNICTVAQVSNWNPSTNEAAYKVQGDPWVPRWLPRPAALRLSQQPSAVADPSGGACAPACTTQEVDEAFESARGAQRSWARLPLWKRAEYLHKVPPVPACLWRQPTAAHGVT